MVTLTNFKCMGKNYPKWHFLDILVALDLVGKIRDILQHGLYPEMKFKLVNSDVNNSELHYVVHEDNLISVVGGSIQTIVSHRIIAKYVSDAITKTVCHNNRIQVPVYKCTSKFALINCQSVGKTLLSIWII